MHARCDAPLSLLHRTRLVRSFGKTVVIPVVMPDGQGTKLPNGSRAHEGFPWVLPAPCVQSTEKWAFRLVEPARTVQRCVQSISQKREFRVRTDMWICMDGAIAGCNQKVVVPTLRG